MAKKVPHQPYHQNIAELPAIFHGIGAGINPLTADGYKQVLSNEGLSEKLKKHVSSLISDESYREVVESMMDNSMALDKNLYRGMYAMEGLDGTAINANYLGAVGPANLHAIVGYVAKTKVLDMFQMIKDKTPTIVMKYNIMGVTKGTDGTTYQLAEAVANGTIGNLTQLSEAKPIVAPENPWIADLGAALDSGNGQIYIKNQSQGNLLKEAGYNYIKHNLARNIRVGFVVVHDTSVTPAVDVVVSAQVMGVEAIGRAEERMFHQDVSITYQVGPTNALVTRTMNVTIIGKINLDTGAYSISVLGGLANAVVTHFQFSEAFVENPANEEPTVRPTNRIVTAQFNAVGKLNFAIPLSPQMLEDFGAYNDVDFVTAMTEQISQTIQGIQEVRAEGVIDAAHQNFDRMDLYEKLKGFGRKSFDFDLASRGYGGGADPYSWARNALKEQVRLAINAVEQDVRIPEEVPYGYYLYGAQKDVEWLLDPNYKNNIGDVAEDGSMIRFGFKVRGMMGYTDHFGRRVKIIANPYQRYANKPVTVMIKAESMDAPTAIYFPFSMRIIPGRAPEMPMIDSLLVYQRDYMGFLSSFQFRLNIKNNNPDLFAKLAAGAPAAATP